jgi:hypothetical protein
MGNGKSHYPCVDEIGENELRFEAADEFPAYPAITIKSEGVYILPRVTKFLPANNYTKKIKKEKRWLGRIYSSLKDIRRRSRDVSCEVLEYPEGPVSKNKNYGKKS